MHHRRLHPALSAALALAAAGGASPAPAHAQSNPTPRVGVVVSIHGGLDDAEATALSEALGRALRARLVVDVIAGAEATRRLPPEGVPGSCIIEAPCTVDLGQRLSVDQLLFLVVNRIGDRVQVDATWVDPATMRTVPRPAVVFDRVDEAEGHFAEAATSLLPDAAVRDGATGAGGGTAGRAGSEAGEIVASQPPPERRTARRMTTGAWIATGVSGAALLGAVTFTILARKDYVALEDKGCGDRGDCKAGDLDALEHKALAADVLWGVAAGAAVTTGVLWWLSGGNVIDEPVENTIAVSAGPGGIGVRGRW